MSNNAAILRDVIELYLAVKYVAAVGPYHSEPERVPEENKASDDDSDASERPGSLN